MAHIPKRIDNVSRRRSAHLRPEPVIQGCGRHRLPKLTGLLK